MGALAGHFLSAEEPVEHLTLLLEPADPLARRPRSDPRGRVVGGTAARADAHLEPPAGEVVHGDGHLRQQRRRPERDLRDHRSDAHPRGLTRERTERRPGLELHLVRVLEVIGEPNAVEPQLLRPLPPRHEVVGGRGLDDHDAEARHAHPPAALMSWIMSGRRW